MRIINVICCDLTWKLKLDCVPMVGDTIGLMGIDKVSGSHIGITATIVNRYITVNPMIMTIYCSPDIVCDMTVEYIKENIEPVNN